MWNKPSFLLSLFTEQGQVLKGQTPYGRKSTWWQRAIWQRYQCSSCHLLNQTPFTWRHWQRISSVAAMRAATLYWNWSDNDIEYVWKSHSYFFVLACMNVWLFAFYEQCRQSVTHIHPVPASCILFHIVGHTTSRRRATASRFAKPGDRPSDLLHDGCFSCVSSRMHFRACGVHP